MRAHVHMYLYTYVYDFLTNLNEILFFEMQLKLLYYTNIQHSVSIWRMDNYLKIHQTCHLKEISIVLLFYALWLLFFFFFFLFV